MTTEPEIKRILIEWTDGTIMGLDITAIPIADPLPESPCCRLCDDNPKFGRNPHPCVCTNGRHFKIIMEPLSMEILRHRAEKKSTE